MSISASHWVQHLISWRWWLLGLAVAIAVVCMRPASQVEYDRSIQNLFSANDPLLEPYRRLQRVFGGNEIVLAVYEDPNLLAVDRSGIRRLATIRGRLANVPGVRAVLSLDRPLGELIVGDDQVAKQTRQLFENYTHGSDGKTAAAVCMLDPEESTAVPRQLTIDGLRSVVSDLPAGLPPGVLAGAPVLVVDGFRHVEQDGNRLSLWSTLLLSLTIVACFRSVRWLVIPAVVVQLTLLVTRSAMTWSGIRLSMVSSMLTAIVTVISVATVVHIIVRYREGLSLGLDPAASLTRAGQLLAAPIVWACVTDAVGFSALIFSAVGPVREFGWTMAIGALLVPLSVMAVVPALVLFRNRRTFFFDVGEGTEPGEKGPSRSGVWPSSDRQRSTASVASRTNDQLAQNLDRVNRWIQKRPRRIVLLVSVLTVLFVIGLIQLEVETDFTKNFRSNSQLVESYKFVEDNLGGAGVWDIIVPAPRQLDWSYLHRIQQLERRLRKEVMVDGQHETPGLSKVLSLADALRATSPTDPGRIDSPLVREGVIRASLAGIRAALPVFSSAMYAPDNEVPDTYYFRIMLRARERQPADQKRQLINQVTRICGQEFPRQRGQAGAEVTGLFVLLASLINSLMRDQWLTFGMALLGITAVLIIAFRNWRYGLVAMVPNALPIIFVLGALGWLGVRVNLGVAMIAAVSLGLSVDSSIHYISFYRRLRLGGQSVVEALGEVQRTVGQAVVLSTLALVVGFAALCSSQFVPTVYFGLLVSVAMLGGLFGNLVLLPLLLRFVAR